MRKIINPWIGHEGYNCFGCAPENPIGLHLSFYEDGDDIVSYWKPSDLYQGWVGTTHGGILSTLIDEVCGWVITRKLQTSGVTTRLNVSYRHPISSTEPLVTARAHIVEQRRNLVTMRATLQDAADKVCVEAEVTYFAMDERRAKSMGFTHCDTENEQMLPL